MDRAPPIGRNPTPILPGCLKHAIEQFVIAARIDSIDLVVGAHDGAGLGTLDRDLECEQIRLAMRRRIDHRIDPFAMGLVAIQREVLDGGNHTLTLDTIDELGAEQSFNERILGDIFEVAPFPGIAGARFMPQPRSTLSLRTRASRPTIWPASRASAGLKLAPSAREAGSAVAVSPGRKPGLVIPRLASVFSGAELRAERRLVYNRRSSAYRWHAPLPYRAPNTRATTLISSEKRSSSLICCSARCARHPVISARPWSSLKGGRTNEGDARRTPPEFASRRWPGQESPSAINRRPSLSGSSHGARHRCTQGTSAWWIRCIRTCTALSWPKCSRARATSLTPPRSRGSCAAS